MSKIVIRIIFTGAAALIPAIASAHPGTVASSGLANGFSHPFTGIDHILAMVAVGVFAAHLGGRALWAVPLTFMSLMAIGGALGVAGVLLPHVETMIALSVIVLGLAVAIPREWPLAAAMALVGAFAVFHGHAHGTEMTESLAADEYGLGFLAATGLLHLTGVAIGVGAASLNVGRLRWMTRVAGLVVAAVGVGLLTAIS